MRSVTLRASEKTAGQSSPETPEIHSYSVLRLIRFRVPKRTDLSLPVYMADLGSGMGKPLPVELRERVVAFIEEGHSHRSAAARFRVCVKFVNDMVMLIKI